jgi:hypothetical protein
MKITCIIEDSQANVTSVIIDDASEHIIAQPFPRSDIRTIGVHVAQLAGYTVDCDTLELIPIHADDDSKT